MPLDIVVKENNNNDSLKKLISLQKELFLNRKPLQDLKKIIIPIRFRQILLE